MNPLTAPLSPALAPGARARIAAWAVDLALVTMMIQLGGSLFEHALVDPKWPDMLALIQPAQGGLDRRLFWIPAHVAATVTLAAALWGHWPHPALRRPVAAAVGLYLALRVWTMIYFVPAALAFEAVDPAAFDPAAGRTWATLSLLRLPLVIAICAALVVAVRRAHRADQRR